MRTAICEIVEFSFGQCPAGSQVGTAEPLARLRAALQRPATSLGTIADRVLGASGRRRRCSSACRAGPRATTASTRKARPIYHPLPIPALNVTLWGVPADPKQRLWRTVHVTAERLRDLLQHPDLRGVKAKPACSANVPPVPYLAGSDHLRCAAGRQCDAPILHTTSIVQADDPWPDDDRLRAADVQPQPHRRADDQAGRQPCRESTSTSRFRRSRARPRRRRRRSRKPRPRCRKGSRSTPMRPTARSACSDADTRDRHP